MVVKSSNQGVRLRSLTAPSSGALGARGSRRGGARRLGSSSLDELFGLEQGDLCFMQFGLDAEGVMACGHRCGRFADCGPRAAQVAPRVGGAAIVLDGTKVGADRLVG